MRRNHALISSVGIIGILALMLMGSTALAKNENSRVVKFALSGAEEFDAQGNPSNPHGDADRGSVIVFFDRFESEPGVTTVCFKFGKLTLTEGESLPHAGHIHEGPAGVAGPVVLHILGTGDGVPAPTKYPTAKICRDAPTELVDAILANPEEYYVNLHNSTHPAGVVRGQFPQEF